MHLSNTRFLLATAIILMASCAVQPEKLPGTVATIDWDTHRLQIQQLEHWQLNGKMGYQQSGDGGSAWIDWQQHSENFEVRLSGPFGAGATYIEGTPEYTRLTLSGEEPITAPTAAELTRHLFGWQWPVEDLRYWMRGIPSPHTLVENQALNEGQRLSSLEQAGWQLEFSRYSNESGQYLPGKIRGKRISDNGDTSFTLIIKSWQTMSNLPQGEAP